LPLKLWSIQWATNLFHWSGKKRGNCTFSKPTRFVCSNICL